MTAQAGGGRLLRRRSPVLPGHAKACTLRTVKQVIYLAGRSRRMIGAKSSSAMLSSSIATTKANCSTRATSTRRLAPFSGRDRPGGAPRFEVRFMTMMTAAIAYANTGCRCFRAGRSCRQEPRRWLHLRLWTGSIAHGAASIRWATWRATACLTLDRHRRHHRMVDVTSRRQYRDRHRHHDRARR